jgi:hypothetical protein
MIDPFLAWVESTALSQWVVGSPSIFAFPGILTFHAIGMGFAVGISAALDLRILGVAPGVPLADMRRFMPFLWAGFWMNAVSGVLLLIGYPTKALTNPVFYLKLTLIGVAMALLARISRRAFASGSGGSSAFAEAAADRRSLGGGRSDPPAEIASTLRNLAIASLICWAGAITSGRLLAYTYHRLTQLH